MELLITPQEVVETAFAGIYGVTADRIGGATIISAQQKFIKPVLGELYAAVEQESYPELAGKIKAALAAYVKLLMIPQLAVAMGNGGITEIKSANFSSTSSSKIKALCDSARNEACALIRVLVEHIEDNASLYPEYDPTDNILNKVSVCAGIIL